MIAFRSVFLHALSTLVWLFLSDSRSLTSFVLGAALGLGLLAAFRDLLGARGYVRRWVGFARYVMIFLREFLASNAIIAWAVLSRRREDMNPGFLSYDVSHLTRLEIFLLAHSVTLTPGTTSVEVSEDEGMLVIHAFDASDPESVRRGIREGLELPLLRFMR